MQIILFENTRWGKCGENPPKKKLQSFEIQLIGVFKSTQSRGRTGMEMNPLVFETSASTDSAIWACRKDGAKVEKYLNMAKS